MSLLRISGGSLTGLLGFFLLGAPAAAQLQDSLPLGSRVRVGLRPESRQVEGAAVPEQLRGSLMQVSGDSLTVDFHPGVSPVTISWSEVSSLERSRGISSRLQTAVRTAFQLGLLGAIEFSIAEEIGGRRVFESRGAAMLSGALTGGGLGVLIGFTHPQERWSRVRLIRKGGGGKPF
jgi:hypothetical protein